MPLPPDIGERLKPIFCCSPTIGNVHRGADSMQNRRADMNVLLPEFSGRGTWSASVAFAATGSALEDASAEKQLPLAKPGQNIPRFPDFPDVGGGRRECRERRECFCRRRGNGAISGFPRRCRTRAAPGMSGKTGMFLPPLARTARFRLAGVTPLPQGCGCGDPGPALRRFRISRHPAMQFASAVRQRLTLTWRAAAAFSRRIAAATVSVIAASKPSLSPHDARARSQSAK